MKILMITGAYPSHETDSKGIIVANLSKAISKYCPVIILSPHLPGASFFENNGLVTVMRFPYFYPSSYESLSSNAGMLYSCKKSGFSIFQLPLYFISEIIYGIKICRKNKIDLIHSHWIIPHGLIGVIISFFTGVPNIISIHGTDITLFSKSRLFLILLKYIDHHCSRISVNSSFTYKLLSSCDSHISDKVFINPMGVDIGKFNHLMRSIPEDFSGFRILFVGRLIPWKGVDTLIDAFYIIQQKYPDSRLTIIGEGPEYETLTGKTKILNISHLISFMGMVSDADLMKQYLLADIFVLPSKRINDQTEGLGVVLLEAMASGIPVIGSNTGGIPDIIEDGVNGFLVPPGDAAALADRIITLQKNQELYKKFSLNGRRTVEEKYSWDSICKRFISVYHEVISSNDNK